uniref:Sema domain-containing protein n=1 Tax=Electrophorus electricus TaxID=8005 RepID=A0A4W4DQR6_ELEEL
MPPSTERVSLTTPALFLAVFLTSHWTLHSRPVGALQIQQAFTSPNETNNFVVDEVSRRVYLATVNSLYQLNATLVTEVENGTGPVKDSMLCHAPQLPQAPCEHAKTLTDNYNKLLVLDREQKVLVTCGSVYQGFCELRKMDNVSQIAVEFPKPNATVFPSMLNIVANHPNASTVGLIFRSQEGTPRLLVGATYTGMGTEYFPKNHSKEDLRFENTPEIAIRSLNTKDLNRLFTYDINPSEDNVFKIKQEVKPKNKLSFVHAFTQKSYSYIAINNDANTGLKESQPNSILARICLDTDGTRKSTSESRKLTESYIQMGLKCGANGDIYNRIVSVFPAEINVEDRAGVEPYLFGVFTKANRKSALCAFRFADIEETIRQGRRNCSNGPNSDVQVLDSVIQGSGAECETKVKVVLQPELLNCGAAHLQHPLALRKPLSAAPLYEASGLSSVAVDNVHNRTVVFLGTVNGRLHKLSLLRNLSVANKWSLRLPAGESVHHIMTFDPNDRDYLYLMTTHHLLRVQVAVCGQYTSCSDCLSACDAFCGWCTLESRCSIQRECSSGGVSRSWISLKEGPQQCPSMTFTPPEFSTTTDIKVPQTHLILNPDRHIKTLPQTVFFFFLPLWCNHISVPVAIKVKGISVVSGRLIIYDCGRTADIHPNTACTSCLSTKWRCYWDQQSNACISDKDNVQGMVLEVSTVNHPINELHAHNSCAFKPSPPITKITHIAHARTKQVYSCSGGDSDCSQCWGREQQGHLCAWCDNSCRPRQQCQPIGLQCPDPSVHKIQPLNGPLGGGTLLTVQGRNLGRGSAEVKVTIGDVPCDLLPDRYTVSTEEKCKCNCQAHIVTPPPPPPQEPKLDDLMPRYGPLAGGTRLTIRGASLKAGSAVKVKVNATQDYFDHLYSQLYVLYIIHMRIYNSVENLVFERWKLLVICLISQAESCDLHVLSDWQVCSIPSSTLILCRSPAAGQSQQVVAQFYLNGILYRGDGHTSSGLALDEEEESHGGHFLFEYVEDPQFYTANKEKLIKHHPGEPLTLIINVSLDLTEDEYSVMIGSDRCDISFNNKQMFHCTINRTLSFRTGDLPVTVRVGDFQKVIAVVQNGGNELAIIVTVAVCCVLLLLCTVALVVYCTKSRRAERYWQKTLLQMEEMESQIREEIRKGFAELQTDMTDLTKELNRSQGIPFLEYKQFVTRTFFPKMCSDYERSLVQPVYKNDPLGPRALPETHPLLQEWQPPNTTRPNMEEGITLFSTLLNNKHFLVTFVHALEQQKDFAVRDRLCNLASLLTIALHGKLEYYTSIMKELLVDLIDASASKNPKLMLRRTESVVEKMLTNWMSICMYGYLKETVGEPFFLLLCAIKQQINKGSIDAITGKARYTLNEEWLLRENIEAKPLNINVSFQGFGMDSVSVRVMNTDTICQLKEKILEAFYKNLPYSQWPREEDVELEWFPGVGCRSRILQDLDNTSVMEDGRKKLNTVFHYQIPEGASLAMSMKDKRENTLGRAKDLDTEKYVHLVLPHDELTEMKKSHRHSHRKKVLPEIYLTRLLSTKGTLQKFLDDLFQAILSISQDRPPLAVKYFFDFLEEQADKRGITDPDTLHIWKTNSLPLRFWVNILKNPQFVFDIDKTDHMDACLSVIAQAFIDACSISDLQLGKDSPTNKLLYAKEIPEYKKRVQSYYKQIQDMPPLSEQEMNAHLAEESRKYRNEFNTNLALTEIYKYAKRYRTQVVNALDSNPTARRTQLQHKFDQVIALMEDNIYECCSEA